METRRRTSSANNDTRKGKERSGGVRRYMVLQIAGVDDVREFDKTVTDVRGI